jgi:hypothetical protein
MKALLITGLLVSIALSEDLSAQSLSLQFSKTSTQHNAGEFTQNSSCRPNYQVKSGPTLPEIVGGQIWYFPHSMYSNPAYSESMPLCASSIDSASGIISDKSINFANLVAPLTEIKNTISKDSQTAAFIYRGQFQNADYVTVLRANNASPTTYLVAAPAGTTKDVLTIPNSDELISFSWEMNSNTTRLASHADDGMIRWQRTFDLSGRPNKLASLGSGERFILLTTTNVYVLNSVTGDVIFSALMWDNQSVVESTANGTFIIPTSSQLSSFTPEGNGYRHEVINLEAYYSSVRAFISKDGNKIAMLGNTFDYRPSLKIYERPTSTDSWIKSHEQTFQAAESLEGGVFYSIHAAFFGSGNRVAVGFQLSTHATCTPSTPDLVMLRKTSSGSWVTSAQHALPGKLINFEIIGGRTLFTFSAMCPENGVAILNVYKLTR